MSSQAREPTDGLQEALGVAHLHGHPGPDGTLEVPADLREPARAHGRLQPWPQPGLVGTALPPRTPVQNGVLLEALRHLIGGVGAEHVEEGRTLSGDVLGDHDAVLGDRVDVGIEALQGSYACGTGEMAIEERFGHTGRPAGCRRVRAVGKVPLHAQVGRQR